MVHITNTINEHSTKYG